MDPFIPYDFQPSSIEEVEQKSAKHLEEISKRRSIRSFGTSSIPKKVIENILFAANSAPSGANKQPWHFCAVADKEIKTQIRKAAEEEEYTNYHGRMSDAWLEDLKPLGTDWEKPFLTEAPWLIVVFKRIYDVGVNGEIQKNYYVNESVGIACGMLINAIHSAGLVTLTHTPSPMNFLQKILQRPENEKPYLLLPIGFPAPNTLVPNILKKIDTSVIQIIE